MPLVLLTCDVSNIDKHLPRALKHIAIAGLRPESDGETNLVRGYVSKCWRSEKQLVKFHLTERDSAIPVFIFGTLATEADNLQDGDFVVLSGFEIEPYIGTSHTLQLVLNSRPGKIWMIKQQGPSSTPAARGAGATTRSSGQKVPSQPATSSGRQDNFLMAFSGESPGSWSAKKRKTAAESSYSYTALSAIKANTVVNIYGVVKFAKLPKKSGGTDFWQSMSLTDQSLGSGRKVQCVFFCRSEEQLPKCKIGQILRLHRVKVQFHNGVLQVGNSHGFAWLQFDGAVGGSVEPVATSSPNYALTDEDKEKVRLLQAWAGTEPELRAEDHSKTLAEIEPGIYLDLVCQVVAKCHIDDRCVLLRVWDGTRPIYPVRVIDTEAAEENLEIFEPLRRKVEPLTFDVCLFDDHISSALRVKLGSFIKLANLHAAVYKAANTQDCRVLQTIELCIHHGTAYGRGIEILPDNSPAVTKLREKLNAVIETLPNQLFHENTQNSESQGRDATNTSNEQRHSSGFSIELSMSDEELEMGTSQVAISKENVRKNTSKHQIANKGFACDVQELDSQPLDDDTGGNNTQNNRLADALYSESQAIQELGEQEVTAESMELSFNQSDLGYDPDAVNTLDVSPVQTRKNSAGIRKSLNKETQLANQKNCLKAILNSLPVSGYQVNVSAARTSKDNGEAPNQNKVSQSRANENIDKESQSANHTKPGKGSLEADNQNDLMSSRLRSNMRKSLVTDKGIIPPDKGIVHKADGKQDIVDQAGSNTTSKAVRFLPSTSRRGEAQSSHRPPEGLDAAAQQNVPRTRPDRCMLQTGTVTTDHHHISPSSLSSVIHHPIVPNMFRVQAHLLDIMPRAQAATEIIRLYCPKCNYLSFVPSRAAQGKETAASEVGQGRSKPIQGRQSDGVTYYNCPDCIAKRNNNISPPPTADSELEYVFMLMLLLRDKTEWLSVKLWRDQAVTFFQAEPTEVLKDAEKFRFLMNKLETMIKSGKSAAGHSSFECCIKSYYAPNNVCHQIFDTKIVI